MSYGILEMDLDVHMQQQTIAFGVIGVTKCMKRGMFESASRLCLLFFSWNVLANIKSV